MSWTKACLKVNLAGGKKPRWWTSSAVHQTGQFGLQRLLVERHNRGEKLKRELATNHRGELSISFAGPSLFRRAISKYSRVLGMITEVSGRASTYSFRTPPECPLRGSTWSIPR